jgi:ATP-dependent protease HslVU (ClpYQ) peptidase subunit
MTCIVGIEQGNTVFIGGDSAATSSDLKQRVIADRKVFVIGEFAFGVCGLPKVMDALRFNIKFPQQAKGTDDREYIASEFIPTFKAGLQSEGCVLIHKDHGEYFQGAILVGYRGKLYNVESNFQVITSAYGFDSVGSGSDIAMGSLHATKSLRPKKRILQALEASAINNAGVRPPFAIVSVKKAWF